VGPGADLDDMVKRKFFTLPGLELRSLSFPARSQSLYRLVLKSRNTLNCQKRRNGTRSTRVTSVLKVFAKTP
jgi:hypothetical protein